jgi:hypothetical protein
MKNFTLLVAIFSVFSLAKAQNFNYDTTTHFSIYEEAGGTYSMSVHFLPFDSSDITFKWKTLENTLSPEWSMSLCDFPNCFFEIPDSATMWPITTAQFEQGTRGFFTLLVSTDDTARVGSLSLYVYDSTDVTIGDTIRWDVETYAVEDTTDTVTSVSSVIAEDIEVFPNPTEQYFNIRASLIQSVELFDLLGAQVMKRDGIMNDKFTIDMNEFPSGIYMLHVSTAMGSHTEKVVKR